MTKILVTTDFSPESEAALKYARKFAELLGKDTSNIILLSVLEDMAQKGVQFQFALALLESHGIREKLHNQADEKIEKLKEKYFSGLNAQTEIIVASKAVHLEIVEYAETHEIDFLVIANHAMASVSQVILGSVLEKVLRGATCPVLAVPTRIEGSP